MSEQPLAIAKYKLSGLSEQNSRDAVAVCAKTAITDADGEKRIALDG